MGCGREPNSGLKQFIAEIADLRKVVIVGPNKEEVVKTWRALAVAFGETLSEDDEVVFRQAKRAFGVHDEVQFFTSQTGKSEKYRWDFFDEVETTTNTVRFQKLTDEPSWLRSTRVYFPEFRNNHPDQQARIQAHQKRARNSPAPVNGKKLPRRRFT